MARLFRMLSPGAQAWVLDYGWTVVIAFGFVLGIGAVIFFTRPDAFVVDGYETANVVSSFDSSGDHGFSVRYAFRRADGSVTELTITRAATAALVTTTACLERRAHESGRTSHRIVRHDLCTDGG